MDGLEYGEELHSINSTGTDEDDIWQIRNDSENEENGLLSETANARLVNALNQLIEKYGMNIDSNDGNYTMSQCNEIMDYAWENRLYGDVLELLQADCQFPTTFDINQLNDNNEDEKKLILFAEKRNKFHTLIEHNNLKEIQLIASERTSRFYLSDRNVSACYFSIQCKRFEIYAYLVSEGAEFLNDSEKSILQYLDTTDKDNLAEANIFYSSSVSDSHILYLVARSKSHKPVKNLKQKLYHYYSELDKIPEVSVILILMQYSGCLEIIFDFDADDGFTFQSMSSKHRSRETRYKDGRVFIPANTNQRQEKEILGTIIHQLTHMAMEIIFQNYCNPYHTSDWETEEEFNLISRRITALPNNFYGPWKVLQTKMYYPENEHHSELIALVSQIMVEFKNGKEWLENNVPDLLHFYKWKVIRKCHEVLGKIQYFKSTTV